MKTARLIFSAIIAFLLFTHPNTAGAGTDGTYPGAPLQQVTFDDLIPTFCPTLHVRFDRLLATTWPLINPGIAHIPITENLVQTGDQPLLLTN